MLMLDAAHKAATQQAKMEEYGIARRKAEGARLQRELGEYLKTDMMDENAEVAFLMRCAELVVVLQTAISQTDLWKTNFTLSAAAEDGPAANVTEFPARKG
jgi:hypothetical protein